MDWSQIYPPPPPPQTAPGSSGAVGLPSPSGPSHPVFGSLMPYSVPGVTPGFAAPPFMTPAYPGFQSQPVAPPMAADPGHSLIHGPQFLTAQTLAQADIPPQVPFAATPLPAPVPQHVFPHGQAQVLLSPLSRPTLSQILMEHGRVPDTVNHFDTVALPSEMPIGSLVHLQNSTTYGVIKITNIPYSITKSEIHQFIGRDAPLVSPIKGCAVHIIMERPTAKTMDCYVEFETKEAAKVIQTRLTAMVEQGHRRLGSRHVDVELSSEDELLKDLFPRAKCVEWKDGKPHLVENTDPFSTGFTGFFTNEEIVNAIRHAENPQRSPFCNKCPQRTYESTISTLYKFPWHETHMYTVGDRNLLFELTSRQIKTLASRVKNSKTVGLDQRLLRDLLHAGLRCPSFNERMKYTLCFYSEDIREITRFSEAGKWFPFDTLVRMPGFNEATMMHYAKLITKGSTVEEHANAELPNSFPPTINLQSPYGRIWYEWSLEVSKYKSWESAVQREMVILCNLVLAGWIQAQRERNPALANGDDEALGAISSTTASAGSAPGPVGLPTINVTQANNGVPVNPYFLPEFTQLGGNTHANNYNGPQVNAGHGNAVVNPGFPFAPAGFGL